MIGNDTARRNFCVVVRLDNPAMFTRATSDSLTDSSVPVSDYLICCHQSKEFAKTQTQPNKIYLYDTYVRQDFFIHKLMLLKCFRKIT